MFAAATNNEMAVIGFSDLASPLEPAWPSTHRALLPVAGKPIIVHLIEQLSGAGIKHLRVAGSLQQFAVRNRLGNGEEWGVTIRYSDLHGPDLCVQTLVEHKRCLYFIGDQLLNVEKALESQSFSETKTGEFDRLATAAYWAIDERGPRYFAMANSDFARGAQIKTSADFHRVNKMLVTGRITDFELPGRAISKNVRVGWDNDIDPTAVLEPGVTIGNQCYIGSGVYLGSGCVVGDGCVIRPGARLSNVSVLPNCFVGSRVRLRDGVITPRAIFDLEGKYWLVDDRSIISRVRSNDELNTGLPAEELSELEQSSRTFKFSAKPGASESTPIINYLRKSK